MRSTAIPLAVYIHKSHTSGIGLKRHTVVTAPGENMCAAFSTELCHSPGCNKNLDPHTLPLVMLADLDAMHIRVVYIRFTCFFFIFSSPCNWFGKGIEHWFGIETISK